MSLERIEASREVVGYYKIADLTAATLVPGNVVDIQAEGGTIRYRLDGGVPTSTVGTPIYDGQNVRLLLGDNELRIISGDGASANVHHYR